MSYSVILLNNNRSKAYLQTLCAYGFYPEDALVFHDGSAAASSTQTHFLGLSGFRASFNMQESIFQTLKKEKIPYKTINSIDPNSEESIRSVASLAADYVLYSGPAGVILKPKLLNIGKRLMHAHPGMLPKYRGSTTIYYSMLLENKAGCSVIFMDEGIDTGTILFSKEFKLGDGFIDYDVTVDCIVRAETLLEMFEKTKGDLATIDAKIQKGTPNTFYIIHPVLKHLSISKASGMAKAEVISQIKASEHDS